MIAQYVYMIGQHFASLKPSMRRSSGGQPRSASNVDAATGVLSRVLTFSLLFTFNVFHFL